MLFGKFCRKKIQRQEVLELLREEIEKVQEKKIVELIQEKKKDEIAKIYEEINFGTTRFGNSKVYFNRNYFCSKQEWLHRF